MNRPAKRGATSRVTRGTMVAGCSGALAVSAHTVGEGRLPQLALTALLMVLIGWISAAAVERTRGPLGILTVLGGAQLITHLMLGELSGHGGGGLPMIASHAGATVLAALLLARAESMLAVAAAAVNRLWPRLWREPPPPTVRVPAVVVRPPGGEPIVEVLLGRMCRRRGPPSYS